MGVVGRTRTRTSSFRAQQIAVKVIHPQVRRAVDLDLKFLQAAAWAVDRLGFEGLGVSLALRQFSEFIRIQADFTCEAKNLAKFREHFKDNSDNIVIPKVIDPWVTRDVVVMSFEDGEPLKTLMEARNEVAGMSKAKKEAWRQIVDAFWAMVFKHRLVHGDMHPGNVLWQIGENGCVKLVLIDCGLAVDLSGDAGADLSMMVKAFLTQSPEDVARKLMKLSERVGGRPEDVYDPEGFVKGIAALIVEANECAFKLSKLNAGALMGRSLFLGRKHRVRFDARFVNLMVAMMVLQGVAMSLNPDGDFLTRMHPFVLKAAVKGTIRK